MTFFLKTFVYGKVSQSGSKANPTQLPEKIEFGGNASEQSPATTLYTLHEHHFLSS